MSLRRTVRRIWLGRGFRVLEGQCRDCTHRRLGVYCATWRLMRLVESPGPKIPRATACMVEPSLTRALHELNPTGLFLQANTERLTSGFNELCDCSGRKLSSRSNGRGSLRAVSARIDRRDGRRIRPLTDGPQASSHSGHILRSHTCPAASWRFSSSTGVSARACSFAGRHLQAG